MATERVVPSIPDVLREYLVREQVTQGQLAVRLRVNPSQVSNWISGKARPSLENALAIARITGRPPRQVLEAAGYEAPDDVPAPAVPPWLAELLEQLTEAELEIVGATARGLLRLREERAHRQPSRAAGEPGGERLGRGSLNDEHSELRHQSEHQF